MPGPGLTEIQQIGESGICSIRFKQRSFRFRTNPNSIRWKYALNTKVENTYGGRVIQLLSVKIEDLTVTAEAGVKGWEEIKRVSDFMRDLMIEQRDGTTATFEYTTRGWSMKVYVVNIPFSDEWNAVNKGFTIQFKVQEDVSGIITSNSLSAELARLQDGIGFKKSKYNQPEGTYKDSEQGWIGMSEQIPDSLTSFGAQVGSITGSLEQTPSGPVSPDVAGSNRKNETTNGSTKTPNVPFPIPQPKATDYF